MEEGIVPTRIDRMNLKFRGFTLIELTIAIVVLGVSLASLNYAAMVFARSASNPFVQQQAVLVAEAYMREIMGAAYLDAGDNTKFCPTVDSDKASGRANYDNLCDYDGINDTPPQFPSGVSLAGTSLANYTVRVKVYCPAAGGCSQVASSSLGPASPSAPAVALTSGAAAVPNLVRIDVVVSVPSGNSYTLTSYRGYHPNVYTPSLGFSWYQAA